MICPKCGAEYKGARCLNCEKKIDEARKNEKPCAKPMPNKNRAQHRDPDFRANSPSIKTR